MKTPSAPKPPDPGKTAAAQTGTNIGTAVANQILGNVNQRTPYGSLNYDQTGSTQWTDPQSGRTYDIPTYTATQTLSPDQQRLNNIQSDAEINLAKIGRDQSERLGGILKSDVDLSAAPGYEAPRAHTVNAQTGRLRDSYGETGGMEARDKAEAALMARINPQLDRDRERLETSLINQGVRIGSEQYDRAMEDFGRQSNDARLGAILGAGDELSRMEGIARDRATFENQATAQRFNQRLTATDFNAGQRQQRFGNQLTARNQYLGEQYANRNQPINEIAALLGTGQVSSPQFVNTAAPQMPTVDYAGLTAQNYNQRMQGYNSRLNQQNQRMGGLFGAVAPWAGVL